jgi:hypothetical protein
MPERKLDSTIQKLTPLLNDPELVKKVSAAADKNTTPQTSMVGTEAINTDNMMDDDAIGKKGAKGVKGLKKGNNGAIQTVTGNNTMLSQVVGIIIGSPEFQRK